MRNLPKYEHIRNQVKLLNNEDWLKIKSLIVSNHIQDRMWHVVVSNQKRHLIAQYTLPSRTCTAYIM